MSVISIEGGRLGMRQLARWSRDRLVLEIRDVSNAIRIIEGKEPAGYTTAWFEAMRGGPKYILARELLGLFDLHADLLREREDREQRVNNEAVRRTLGLTVDGRSLYEVEGA